MQRPRAQESTQHDQMFTRLRGPLSIGFTEGGTGHKVGNVGRRGELGSDGEGEGVAMAAPRQGAPCSLCAAAGSRGAAPEDRQAPRSGSAGRKPGVSLQEDGMFQGTWVSGTAEAQGAGSDPSGQDREVSSGHMGTVTDLSFMPCGAALGLRRGELRMEDWTGHAGPRIASFSTAEATSRGIEILLRIDRQGSPVPVHIQPFPLLSLTSQIPCGRMQPCPSLLQHTDLQLAPAVGPWNPVRLPFP